MTRQRSFKERIRARMDKTGESYATARRRLIEKSEAEARKRRTPRTISRTRTSDESVRARTGRTYEEWFALLDDWDATARKHTEIARWLVDEHGVDGWWAQSVTVAYEQERGMRAPGQRADGTYGAGASKTIAAPVATLYDAFVDESTRERWLGDFELTIRTARPGKSITAAWEEGTSRLGIGFVEKGPDRSQVSLEHGRLPDAQAADEMKAFWRERLDVLKKLLES
ncbi:MAG TPA: DUF4287 domain-containing protein [Actinomycetota bacterium]|nr:DUF4287 domain-containing protein [Actinomycetota bacterium]